jgi:hypothetical protein
MIGDRGHCLEQFSALLVADSNAQTIVMKMKFTWTSWGDIDVSWCKLVIDSLQLKILVFTPFLVNGWSRRSLWGRVWIHAKQVVDSTKAQHQVVEMFHISISLIRDYRRLTERNWTKPGRSHVLALPPKLDCAAKMRTNRFWNCHKKGRIKKD